MKKFTAQSITFISGDYEVTATDVTLELSTEKEEAHGGLIYIESEDFKIGSLDIRLAEDTNCKLTIEDLESYERTDLKRDLSNELQSM